MTLSSTPTELHFDPGFLYSAVVDGGNATIEEFRNGAWREVLSLQDGVTPDPFYFETDAVAKNVRVSGSGELLITRVRIQ